MPEILQSSFNIIKHHGNNNIQFKDGNRAHYSKGACEAEEIFSEISDKYPEDRDAFREAKKRYIAQYPEEAREFYGD